MRRHYTKIERHNNLINTHVHFLANLGVLFKEQIDVQVYIGGRDAPRKASNYFIELVEGRDTRPEITGCQQQLNYLIIFFCLVLVDCNVCKTITRLPDAHPFLFLSLQLRTSVPPMVGFFFVSFCFFILVGLFFLELPKKSKRPFNLFYSNLPSQSEREDKEERRRRPSSSFEVEEVGGWLLLLSSLQEEEEDQECHHIKCRGG